MSEVSEMEKSGQPNTSQINILVTLHIPHNEAQKKIKNRIEKGQEIYIKNS
jgi:hypothetical protein